MSILTMNQESVSEYDRKRFSEIRVVPPSRIRKLDPETGAIVAHWPDGHVYHERRFLVTKTFWASLTSFEKHEIVQTLKRRLHAGKCVDNPIPDKVIVSWLSHEEDE